MTTNDKDLNEAIADYCNDRLSANERTMFEKRLREDREVAKECNDFRDFRNLYRKIDEGEPKPSDEVFSRVTQAVRLRHNRDERKAVKMDGVVSHLLNAWRSLRASVAVPWAFVAVQAAVIVLLMVPMPQQTSYSTLSGTGLVASAERRGINVVFQASATAAEIQSLLQDIGASVNSGPSREGRYVIIVDTRGDFEVIVRSLRQSKIVTFAEPVH